MARYTWKSHHKAWVKTCSCCKVEIIGTANRGESYEIFTKSFAKSNGAAGMADGLQSRCNACNHHRRRELGVTLEFLRDMHKQQEGCCAICDVPISLDNGAPNPANVDHDYKTWRVRQLLCGNCNRGIGLFFDNPQFLREAADYIEWHKANSDEP